MKRFSGSIDKVYKKLICSLKKANKIGNTREISNCVLEIDHPTTKVIYFPLRNISEIYANAELRWYWSADNRCSTIGQYAKMWLKLSDDGVTNNSAYGYIIHKKYPFDQLQLAIDCLKADKNSRRAVINISDPAIDKLKTNDMQCTIALQFLIRNEKLEMTVYMRSNDVYFGLPYDYIYFTSLAEYVAKKLDIEFVKYTHIATSMHMYEKDIKKFVPHNNVIRLDVESLIGECYEK